MYKLTDLYKQIKEEEQVLQVSQYKIFCDMDGVLCDFDRRFEQFGGMSPSEYEAKFGKYRFAFGRFEIDFTKTSIQPQITEPIATSSSNWDVRIGWADESFQIKFPPGGGSTRLKSGPGGGKTSAVGCPKF